MNVQKWEATIQTMTDAFNLETKESGKNLILMQWRKSLASEPQLLKPFQIDAIVREVRKRSTSVATAPQQPQFQAVINPATLLDIA